MWYEILPSIGVIFTAMTLGCCATAWVPNLILGKPTMRALMVNHQWEEYQRDRRLTGSAYKMQGLEAIPDENQTDNKTKKSS